MKRIQITIDEEDLRNMVVDYMASQLNVTLKPEDVRIEVKSKQNYKSEWENASFRATVDKSI